MNITVCTACYYDTMEAIWPLSKSCEKHGMKLHTFGLGENAGTAYEIKVLGLVDFLRTVQTKHVLYIDGADVLLAGGIREIARKYVRALNPGTDPILLGTEVRCWPYGSLRATFIERADRAGRLTEFVYPAPGMIMGETNAIIKALEVLKETRKNHLRLPYHDDDMGLWSLSIADGSVNPSLDYRCDVTIPFMATSRKLYELRGKRIHCRSTGTMPPILHYNGLRRPRVRKLLGRHARRLWGEE